MPEQTHAAFISYCRDDQEFALRLAQDLKAAGAAIWLDQLDIEPGAPWDNAVEDALIAAPRMLLVLSPASSRSRNVRNEISFALEQGKVVIPVLYQECVVPLQLQRNNRIDFRADYAKGLGHLLAHLEVAHPDPAVLDRAAEGDLQRQTAWQAREAEAERLRLHEEQAQQLEDARLAQQETLRRENEAEARLQALQQQKQESDRLAAETEARNRAADAKAAEEVDRTVRAEAQRREAEARAAEQAEAARLLALQQKKAESDRLAAEAESHRLAAAVAAQPSHELQPPQKKPAAKKEVPPPLAGPPSPVGKIVLIVLAIIILFTILRSL